VRLVVISDTHGLHNMIDNLPDGDVLVHAGDFMNSGYDVQGASSLDVPMAHIINTLNELVQEGEIFE